MSTLKEAKAKIKEINEAYKEYLNEEKKVVKELKAKSLKTKK